MDRLRISLSKLGRGHITRSIEIADPEAQLGELPPGLGPLRLEVEIRSDAGDGLRARGVARTHVELQCRRCLTPRTLQIAVEFGFLYRTPVDVMPGEEGVWPIDEKAREVDLTDALREELWIAAPEYTECDPDCAGLCSRCGARLPDQPCTCPPPDPDPRWRALRGTST